MRNISIRNAAKEAGVYHYQVADALGVAESTLTRWLRKELSESEQKRIIEIINRIAKEAQS